MAATDAEVKALKSIRLEEKSQQAILSYCKGVLVAHKQNTAELNNKMTIIDQAYARFKVQGTGEDGLVSCDIFDKDRVTPPIVVSQVDSLAAYLAEVFLTGSPLFPVVSTPSNKQWAEQLEVLLDDHAQIGGYARQMLMFLRDAVKYNYSAIEVDWAPIEQFEVLSDFMSGTGQKLNKNKKYFNKITRLDPYNVIRDPDVLPGDVAKEGDYAGYVESITYIKLKRMMLKWNAENKAYNFDKIFSNNPNSPIAQTSTNITEHPNISNYMTPKRSGYQDVDWDVYLSADPTVAKKRRSSGKRFEMLTLYGRIMPSDMGIKAPQQNTPQIWKFRVINNSYVAYAERIISAYDYLPILFGQPLEDGLGYQTQSVAEGEIPFQEATGTLFNIRFAAARRAVADRALYLPELIKPSDVNSKVPAAKIPVNIPALSQRKLGDAYMQIPFDMRGTETTISDAREIVAFSGQLHGINGPRQGNFQKGNKSVQEWNDTMGSSDGRSRLPALCLEHQVFIPLKEMIKLNIFQYGQDALVVSQKTGEQINVKIDELRKQVLAFRLADGYTPKSKLASTDAITAGLNMIMQSPALQQQLGDRIVPMFTHMMSLMGVRGLDEYVTPAQPTAPATPGGLPTNILQNQAPAATLPDPNNQLTPTAP